MDIMKRVMFGSVTVSGLPALICPMNSGMTEPRDAMTLPYRPSTRPSCPRRCYARTPWRPSFSIIALEMPIALTG